MQKRNSLVGRSKVPKTVAQIKEERAAREAADKAALETKNSKADASVAKTQVVKQSRLSQTEGDKDA